MQSCGDQLISGHEAALNAAVQLYEEWAYYARSFYGSLNSPVRSAVLLEAGAVIGGMNRDDRGDACARAESAKSFCDCLKRSRLWERVGLPAVCRATDADALTGRAYKERYGWQRQQEYRQPIKLQAG